jgi:hypothetical protein
MTANGASFPPCVSDFEPVHDTISVGDPAGSQRRFVSCDDASVVDWPDQEYSYLGLTNYQRHWNFEMHVVHEVSDSCIAGGLVHSQGSHQPRFVLLNSRLATASIIR